MSPATREPIIVADAGPLIRLAAAGLIDTLRGFNRRIVLVDRVEDEVVGDLSKPFATEIRAWIDRMGDAVERVHTVTGEGIASLRARERSAADDALLKAALRDSGEQAVREFVGRWQPGETGTAIVLYEDRKVPVLFLDADFPVTLMTTRYFASLAASWGVNGDAEAALEAISDQFDLKPALVGHFDPATPADLRRLPAPPEKAP